MKSSIKYDAKYSAEQWAEMVYNFEYEHARDQIAKGAVVDEVLEQMAKRIMEKMLVPEIQKIKRTQSVFDVAENKRSYEEIMKKHQTKN